MTTKLNSAYMKTDNRPADTEHFCWARDNAHQDTQRAPLSQNDTYKDEQARFDRHNRLRKDLPE